MTGERGIFGLSATAVRRLLLASLVLNFLLIGIAVGVGYNAERKKWRGPSSFLTMKIVELVDEDRREAVETALSAHRDARKQRRGLRMERFSAIATAIGEQPFKREALIAAMMFGRGAVAQSRALETKSFAEAVALLTDGERAALAASFEAYIARRIVSRR